MSDNSGYWSDRFNKCNQALEHHKMMQARYSEQTGESVKLSKIYSDENTQDYTGTVSKPEVILTDMVTVTAAAYYQKGRTAILNFASYKEPGGMFLKGSTAQEECLCHASNLYEILSSFPEYYEWNNKHLNRALYLNRAIASPDVIFTSCGKEYKFDVITCAAPNASAYLKYNTDSGNIERALDSRIGFIKKIIEAGTNGKAETFILGAFGCGVFGLNPDIVASKFSSYFETSSVKRIVYAIIDKNSKNFKAFENIV